MDYKKIKVSRNMWKNTGEKEFSSPKSIGFLFALLKKKAFVKWYKEGKIPALSGLKLDNKSNGG